jgi:hypothetical protein
LFLALFVALASAPVARAVTFSDASGSPVVSHGEAGGVAVADFNGDGHPDVAVPLTSGTGYLAVLLGDGHGHLSRASDSPTQLCFSGGVAAADFNGDGKVDLAIACWEGNTQLLWGNGDGTFTAGGSFGGAADSVAVGDFNGDGHPDLVETNDWRNIYASVWFGDGHGSFSSGPSIPVSDPGKVATGDLNHDGISDLAVVGGTSYQVSIFLGQRDGSFAPANGSPMQLRQRPRFPAIADFNGDGNADLAVSYEDGNLSVLGGDGSGRFGAAIAHPVALGYEGGLAAGDFDGDGRLDLAGANDNIDPGKVSVLLNSPPPVSITSAPAGSVRETGATIGFRSDDPTATFACQLDSGRWTACTDPVRYAGLAHGPHTVHVRATNDAGLAGLAGRDWNVDLLTPPVAQLAVSPSIALTGQPVALDASASHDPLDGTITDFRWNFDGGGPLGLDSGTNPKTTTTYFEPGIKHPQVRVTNELGLSAVVAMAVDVRPAPPPGPVGVSINNGDYATSSPPVRLSVVWPAFASTALVSNDGGFSSQAGTSLLPLASTISWKLRSAGHEKLTKVVYLRFPGTPLQDEIFTDDIVLDTLTPSVGSASFVGSSWLTP